MHRGGDQHALAVLARQLEHGMPHMLPGRVVKQEVIAAPRRDLHGVVGVRHIVQHIGIDARRIDDAARLQRAAVGFDGPAASVRKGVQPRYRCVELKLYAVLCGVFCQRVGQPERADDAAGGRPERCHRLIGDIRLHRSKLVPLDDAQPLHAVGDAVFIEFLQRGAVLLAQADDQTAALGVGKIQLLGQRGHPAAALDIEFRHQAAVGSIIAGMYNSAVGLGGAAADILRLIQHQNIRAVARKFPRAGTPGHACADNDYIMHMLYLVLFVCRACRGDHWSPAESVRCWKPSGSMRASTPTA